MQLFLTQRTQSAQRPETRFASIACERAYRMMLRIEFRKNPIPLRPLRPLREANRLQIESFRSGEGGACAALAFLRPENLLESAAALPYQHRSPERRF